MKVISKSKKETQRIGADFARKINPPQPPFFKGGQGGFLIGLYGDLGSGKTTFVQGMARGLGIDPDYYVNSPTFTLVNEYRGKEACLIHVDLYRIAKPGEAEMLALEEYVRPGNIVVIEWAERLPRFFQELDFEVRLRGISDTAKSSIKTTISTCSTTSRLGKALSGCRRNSRLDSTEREIEIL